MGLHKSPHSPRSYASLANIFTHSVWLKQELPQASQGSAQISLSGFKAGVDENYFGDGKGGWEEFGWGPGSFKTRSSDKEIGSLPQCLHSYCVLVTSEGSFQNSVSKMKSVTFIFLNVSIFPCSFCLEIGSAPCCNPQWNHGDTSRWTEFRFAILTGKQRREQWKKTMVTFFWCNFCLQTSFQNSYISAERLIDIAQNAETCPAPWNRKNTRKIQLW